jgi:hypothetical protein
MGEYIYGGVLSPEVSVKRFGFIPLVVFKIHRYLTQYRGNCSIGVAFPLSIILQQVINHWILTAKVSKKTGAKDK